MRRWHCKRLIAPSERFHLVDNAVAEFEKVPERLETTPHHGHALKHTTIEGLQPVRKS